MSDTEKLLERIAALESQLAPLRKDSGKPAFDMKRATLDPVRYFQELGLDVTNMSRHFVANALGKDCPPELSAMVQMGPTTYATTQLEELVTSLSRKVDQIIDKDKQKELVASVKTSTVDPVKYPTLAAAIKTDPTILESELRSLGAVADSSEAMQKIESKLAPYAKAFGFKVPVAPSTNQATQNTTTDTSTEIKPANNGFTGSEVPPLVTLAPGAFTDEDHQKLKAAVLKKYSDNA